MTFDLTAVWKIGQIVPLRFIGFALVGALGVAVHFAVLTLVFRFGQAAFLPSQAIATVLAMTFNYSVNNVITYRDQRLRGRRWLHGWMTFNLACSIGGVMNVAIASCLYRVSSAWSLAAGVGIVAGAVWNYLMTKKFTWVRTRAVTGK